MGLSTDYSQIPDWEKKPNGYQTGSKVKYKGNVFIANFWADEPGKGDPNENGWRLYDELYDVTSSPASTPTRVIGYIPVWRKKEGFDYTEEEMYLNVTHGIISFLMFDRNNLGGFETKSAKDVDAVIEDIVDTGHRCGTKISIALGGATDYGFLELMERVGNNPGDPALGKAVENVVDFVNANDLDGVDLDLECWWDENNDASRDQGGRLKSDGAHPAGKGLTEFAKQLKQAMPDKTLSAALFATSWYGNCYDPGLIEHLEWLGIMTYDLTGSWNQSPVGPQTSLLKIRELEDYADEQQGEWPANRKKSKNDTDPMSDNPILSVEDSLWYWSNPFFTNWQGEGQNIQRDKLAAGVPVYGYDFAHGKEPDDLSGQVPPGYKAIRYKEILNQFPNAATAENGNIKVAGSTPRPPFVSASGTYPYAHNIYFETPKMATDKLNFLKRIGVRNVIVWELSNDVWDSGKSVVKALYQNSGNPAKQAKPKKPTSPDELTSGGLGSSTVGGSLLPDKISTGGGQTVGGSFGDTEESGRGSAPDIDINSSNVVVAVHEALTEGTLDYKVGRVKGKTVDWSKRQKYGEGIQPSVAINDAGTVIEVHEADKTLRYRVGGIDGDKINFSKSHKYDNGSRPSIAMNNEGLIVEVHKSQNYDELYYHMGFISGNTIEFSKSHKYDSGIRPAVAINDDGLVVEVHQSESHRTLWYRVGDLDLGKGRRIVWRNDGESVQYDKGKRPSVTLTSDGHVIVAHQRSDDLWYRTGVVKGDGIDWLGESSQYNKSGVTPAIASNDATLVEIHGSESGDDLTASVLTLPVSEPKWTKREGEYSFVYFQMEEDNNFDQRVVISETIIVRSGAPFLLANLTKGRDSVKFPEGVMLSISGPNGAVYDGQEPSTSTTSVIRSGSSLQSLVIKEPVAGKYTVSLTAPGNVSFFFGLITLPFMSLTEVSQSKGLQKRGSSDQMVDITVHLAAMWVNYGLRGEPRNLLLEALNQELPTDEDLPVEAPDNLQEAIQVLAQPIPNFSEMIAPPGNVTTAPPGGPVREYVANQVGAVQWLHAEIRPEHLRTGTIANDTARRFVRRLGLPNDDAGHIVGRQLGGTGRQAWNVFPQLVHLNRGVYRTDVENIMVDAVERYGAVSAWYILRYDNPLLPNRPTRFDVLYRLPDGREYIGDLYNPEVRHPDL